METQTQKPLQPKTRQIQAPEIHVVDKVWGREEWFANNEKYCGKLLWLNAGWRCSRHYHPIKDETFVVLTGRVVVETWPDFRAGGVETAQTLLGATAGPQSIHIAPGVPHRFWALKGGACVMEVSSPHSEQDVIRLEDSGPTPEHIK